MLGAELQAALAEAFRMRLSMLGFTATLRVPVSGQDTVGQPVDQFTEYTGVMAYLASAPHPSERETGRVQEDEDWRWLYLDDSAGVEPRPGSEVEVYDATGGVLGTFVVEGDPAHRPGHWVARVRRKR